MTRTRRHEAWDWPPEEEPCRSEPRLRRPLYYHPPQLLLRRTPWWGTPWGGKIGSFVFRLGVAVWMVIIWCALTALMTAGLWLLVALFR